MPTYYRSSEAAPVAGLLAALPFGCASAAGLAVGYVFALRWLATVEILLNPLLSTVFGLLIAVAVAAGARLFHVRSALAVGTLGGASAVVGLSFAWATGYWLAIAGASFFDGLNPRNLAAWIGWLYEHGSWKMVQEGALEPTPVTGTDLAMVWLGEAAIVLIGSCLGYYFTDTSVYCDRCGRWAESDPPLHLKYECVSGQAFQSLLAGGAWDAREFEIARASSDGGRPDHVRLQLVTCPDCTESSYLSIEAVTGRGSAFKSWPLARRQHVSARDVERLRALALAEEQGL